ncbi:MAG: HAMP domain-containing histidine kinase [Erysipelotrichaceae bacterium]|nr:HAMP domain-containing histidine kinase [Erysipelotrichaceae bacterium]
MKKFLRSVAGKTVCFIVCVLSVCLLGISLLGAAFMIEEDFYTRDKEEIYQDIIRGRIYTDIRGDLYQIGKEDKTILKDDSLYIRVLDEEDKVIAETEKVTENWTYEIPVGVETDESGNIYGYYISEGEKTYTVFASLHDTEKNSYYTVTRNLFDRFYTLRYSIYAVALLSLAVSVTSLVILMCVSGRRNEDEEIHPGPLHKIPYDVLLAASGMMLAGMAMIINEFPFETYFLYAAVPVYVLTLICMVLGLLMSLAVRIKKKDLVKGSLIYILCVWLKNLLVSFGHFSIRILKAVPVFYKGIAAILIVCIYELFFIMNYRYSSGAFWILEKIILIPLLLYFFYCLKVLQKGGKALAEGDLSYTVDTKGMILDLKEHGEHLNNISRGMSIAVSEQLKSERMKTELITNVSHDIKTPLTSIINYSDLITKEEDEEKIREYSEVLQRQSAKLKRLIEDLVEVSKASTGNLEVSLMPCDASTFLNQASGEYQDKLDEAGLTLYTSSPEEELTIMADGRRMWRIFDNLMNNIAKYAQPDTRVYLSLERKGNDAVFTFRNTSREQLNIAPEELMERFTRGDASRNTDGNGLGLSIAKSMAELQGGKLDLFIDGDLFKAVLTFPLINQ